jgi:hypothetical protein
MAGKQARVTNITHQTNPPGFFLDPGETFGNRILGATKSMLVEYQHELPDIFQEWAKKHWVTIHDAKDGSVLAGPIAGEITPGAVSPVREMSGADDLEDDEPDLADAREAVLTRATPGHAPDTRQVQEQPKVRVTLGTETESHSVLGMSPIPGDRPRSIDDSEKFTIKAPRSQGVGGVLGGKK